MTPISCERIQGDAEKRAVYETNNFFVVKSPHLSKKQRLYSEDYGDLSPIELPDVVNFGFELSQRTGKKDGVKIKRRRAKTGGKDVKDAEEIEIQVSNRCTVGCSLNLKVCNIVTVWQFHPSYFKTIDFSFYDIYNLKYSSFSKFFIFNSKIVEFFFFSLY